MLGTTCPVSASNSEPGPPIDGRLTRESARRIASIHHVRGIASPMAWIGVGSTASGNTAPATRKSAPANASG